MVVWGHVNGKVVAQGSQTKVSDVLELELQMVVYHVGPGNLTLVLSKISQCS